MCALAISYLGRYVRDAESQMYGKMYQLQRDLYLLGFEDIGQYRQVSYKTVQEASEANNSPWYAKAITSSQTHSSLIPIIWV